MGIDPDLEAAWALLGLAAGADRDQVTRAYRRLARATHPDVSPAPDAAARFSTVADAYRRAVEAAGTGAPGREEVEATVPRTPRARWSGTGFATVGAGVRPLGHPYRTGGAPIVAGPVHIQPPRDPGPPGRPGSSRGGGR
jgi:hypothetical protein